MLGAMSVRWTNLTIDSKDAEKLARWWAEALGAELNISEWGAIVTAVDGGPTLYFAEVPEGKSVKNRLHLDLTADDQQAEVERLISLGASHVDVGQGESEWTVLADPEGNEFCVASA